MEHLFLIQNGMQANPSVGAKSNLSGLDQITSYTRSGLTSGLTRKRAASESGKSTMMRKSATDAKKTPKKVSPSSIRDEDELSVGDEDDVIQDTGSDVTKKDNRNNIRTEAIITTAQQAKITGQSNTAIGKGISDLAKMVTAIKTDLKELPKDLMSRVGAAMGEKVKPINDQLDQISITCKENGVTLKASQAKITKLESQQEKNNQEITGIKSDMKVLANDNARITREMANIKKIIREDGKEQADIELSLIHI